MKRRKSLIYAILVLVVGAVVYVAFSHRGPDPATLTQYKVAKAAIGTVRKTVSATGVLQPWTVIDIKSKAGGKVEAMLVDAGTEVKTGQIIARIDPSDTQLTVGQAQADIDSDRAKIQQSADTYQLQIQQTKIAIANAAAALAAAQSNRAAASARLASARNSANAQPSLTNAAIQQARANYNQAVKQRSLLNATDQQDKAAAQSAYDQAIANATNAQANFTRQKTLLDKGFVSQQVVDDAQANSAVVQAQVESAKTKLDTLGAEQSANLASSDAHVAQALAALHSAQASNVDIQTKQDTVNESAAALKQADAAVTQAEAALNQARANQANNGIRKLDITTAQATEARSQATLKNATDTLSQTTVRSPSEGVILQKYVDTGTIITSGLSLNSTGSSIVQLGDTTRMYVDVTVDETDIANVDDGQQVDISFDAYPGVPFEGKVARINPAAVVEQNVTMIHVRVEVDNSSPTFRLLKPGMNATCDFVVDQKDDVLSVPSSAVQSDDNGSFVQIPSGGKVAPADPTLGMPADPDTLVEVHLDRRAVEVGVQGDESTQITKGLKVGDPVVTQTMEPATPTKTGGSPIGGGFGGNNRQGGGARQGGGGGARR